MVRYVDDFNEITDFRSRSLVMNLYIEYWINEMIVESFVHSEKIINDINGLGTFDKKLKLLESLGIFENIPEPPRMTDILHNIRQIESIRNRYAHHPLLRKNEIDQSIRDKIADFKWQEEMQNLINKLPAELKTPERLFDYQTNEIFYTLQRIYSTKFSPTYLKMIKEAQEIQLHRITELLKGKDNVSIQKLVESIESSKEPTYSE